MFGFGKKKEKWNSISGDLFCNPCEEKIEPIEKVEKQPKEEWVWVEGYKGTEKDMTCHGFQYELGGHYSMPKDEVQECVSGFHLCADLEDVFKYYNICNGRRYFKVRALVKKADSDKYGTIEHIDGGYMFHSSVRRYDKLVASEIEFLEELTLDKIFKNTYAKGWSEKHKKLALEIGLKAADHRRQIESLTDLGYSEPFANLIIAAKKFNIAEAVGSQSDLSMDMKVWTIFNT